MFHKDSARTMIQKSPLFSSHQKKESVMSRLSTMRHPGDHTAISIQNRGPLGDLARKSIPAVSALLSQIGTARPPMDFKRDPTGPAPEKEREIIRDLMRHGIRDASVVIIPNDKNDALIRMLVVKGGSVEKNAALPPHPAGAFDCLSMSQLRKALALGDAEVEEIRTVTKKFPMKIPRYYAQLMQDHDVLKQIVVPSPRELIEYDDDTTMDVHADESQYQPVEGIVHRYPGKLLFFPTLECFGHCRFCFRAGHRVKALSRRKLDSALAYIRGRKDVREVLVTGGDPLVLSPEALDDILGRLRAIDHVEIIRIGTRALAYAPQVITPQFVKMLSKHKPVFMTLSFVHPDEISPYCEEKLNMLSDAGVVMLQQGPILKGVNDDPAVLKRMYEKLARNRVLAYYAIYGIYAPGVRHFIVNRQEAKQLFMKLENHTSGHCLPHLITLDQNDDKTRSVL
jgi:lysine 2,3-aminomutase